MLTHVPQADGFDFALALALSETRKERTVDIESLVELATEQMAAAGRKPPFRSTAERQGVRPSP